MFKTPEKKPKLQCPKCGKRIKTDLSTRELRLYRNLTLPRAGDLTECDECGAILEYLCDPTVIRVQIAPQWRVELLNEAEESLSEPSLSEMVKSIRDQKPMRLSACFHVMTEKTNVRK